MAYGPTIKKTFAPITIRADYEEIWFDSVNQRRRFLRFFAQVASNYPQYGEKAILNYIKQISTREQFFLK
jgi:hypothetical protein